jgi:DNA-directed RNA polymerase subunit beta
LENRFQLSFRKVEFDSSSNSNEGHFYDSPEISEKVDTADDASLKQMIYSMREDGIHVGTPVFDGARESDVKDLLAKASLPSTGQTILFDGRSGEPFTKSSDRWNYVYAETSSLG